MLWDAVFPNLYQILLLHWPSKTHLFLVQFISFYNTFIFFIVFPSSLHVLWLFDSKPLLNFSATAVKLGHTTNPVLDCITLHIETQIIVVNLFAFLFFLNREVILFFISTYNSRFNNQRISDVNLIHPAAEVNHIFLKPLTPRTCT